MKWQTENNHWLIEGMQLTNVCFTCFSAYLLTRLTFGQMIALFQLIQNTIDSINSSFAPIIPLLDNTFGYRFTYQSYSSIEKTKKSLK